MMTIHEQSYDTSTQNKLIVFVFSFVQFSMQWVGHLAHAANSLLLGSCFG